jgi:uncharacterized protein
MKRLLNRLTTNQKLAGLTAILGLGALVIGNPLHGSTVTLDTTELGRIVQTEVDHVSPEELADWIIQGKTDFRLIDLRSEKEFAEYHIPRAENVQLAALADYGLLRNEKIVLYSEGGIHSAQAWLFLRANQYRGATMLRGGLEEWKDRVLFPRLPDSLGAAPATQYEKMKEVSKFFGGTPITGATPGETAAAPSMPTLKMPAAPGGPTTTAAQPKKKKEGC